MPDTTPDLTRRPLDSLRGLIRRFVLLDGLLAAGYALAAGAALSFAADYGLFRLAGVDWVLDAPWALRAALLAAFTLAVAGILAVLVGVRATRRFSDPALALLLEKRFPDQLGDRLITAVELSDRAKAARAGYSPALLQITVAEAEKRLAAVPVRSVFAWKRLQWRLALLVGLAVLSLGGLFLTAVLANPTARRGGVEFADTAGIWAERNLLLRDTPWPRDVYLEVLEPAAPELRIARDAAAPKVRVKAYDWVIADPAARAGWRPLAWDDLAKLGVDAPEGVTVTQAADWDAQRLAASALVGPVALGGERPVAAAHVPLAGRSVDDIATLYGAGHPELAAAFEKLSALAADPANSRTLRKLDAPEEVTLRYAGFVAGGGQNRAAGSSRGELRLTREPNGDYTTELAGLKESVTYTVRAKGTRTDPRAVVLVPPPTLLRLTRTEFRPAYLYHPVPVDAAAVVRDSAQALAGGTAPVRPGAEGLMLKGLRQRMAEKDLSLTGERSVVAVPAGTEVELAGTVDKALTRVTLVPKAGPPRGSVELTGDTFTVRFRGDDRIQGEVAFDIVMADADGVVSRRSVVIQAVEDQAPQVELAVEGLRKFGNGYLCTPRARVVFVKESLVRDDSGLGRVEFEFDVTRLEAASVVGLQSQAIASVYAAAPVAAGWAGLSGPVAGTLVLKRLLGDEARQSGTLAVPPFGREQDALTRGTTAAVMDALARPWAGPEAGYTIRDLKFALDQDALDLDQVDSVLERQGRRMLVTDPALVQPRFKVEVNLAATDTNVVSGPRTSRNLEPIRLTVVGEGELLAEVTKDEETAANKFDEALRKLREAQGKFNQLADRFQSGSVPPDVLLAGRVRAEDILQDAGKGRDLIQAVVTEYARLLREVRQNRCNPDVGNRFDAVIIKPLEQVLANEFKLADDALAAFRDPLADGRAPDQAASANGRQALAVLITRLEQIRRELGEALSLAKSRQALDRILKNQKGVTDALASLIAGVQKRLFAPELAAVAAVTLSAGEKKTVRQAINWNLFDKGELKLRLEPTAGSGLIVSPEISVKDDQDAVEYVIQAGQKPGAYKLKVTPSVGRPVEISVTVK